MSKSAKHAGAAKPAELEMPFEEALQQLEAVVEAMEADDVPLETLLVRFEEGTRLARICQAKLAEAEVKIQRLEKDAAGEFTLQPLAPEAVEE